MHLQDLNQSNPRLYPTDFFKHVLKAFPFRVLALLWIKCCWKHTRPSSTLAGQKRSNLKIFLMFYMVLQLKTWFKTILHNVPPKAFFMSVTCYVWCGIFSLCDYWQKDAKKNNSFIFSLNNAFRGWCLALGIYLLFNSSPAKNWELIVLHW